MADMHTVCHLDQEFSLDLQQSRPCVMLKILLQRKRDKLMLSADLHPRRMLFSKQLAVYGPMKQSMRRG